MREKRGGGGDGIEMMSNSISKPQDDSEEEKREEDNIGNMNSGDFRGWVKIHNGQTIHNRQTIDNIQTTSYDIGYAVPQKPIESNKPGKRTYHKIYNDNIKLEENNLLYEFPVLLRRYSLMNGGWNGGIYWRAIYKPNKAVLREYTRLRNIELENR